MLNTLSTGIQFRLAIALAVFAALCFTLPPAVLAMGHGANTMACLSHADAVNHGMAKIQDQVHDAALSGVAHDGDHAPTHSDHQMTCCGLYCLSAMPASEAKWTDRPALGMPHISISAPRLLSGAPVLLERPPNTLLFV
jgi:hypothetical protein